MGPDARQRKLSEDLFSHLRLDNPVAAVDAREIDFNGEKRSNEAQAVDDKHLKRFIHRLCSSSRYRIFP